MPVGRNESLPSENVLRLFNKLMWEGRRHFQVDLAEEFECSIQTINRWAQIIEAVIGINLESGLEQRRRWYQIRSVNRSRLPLDFEELRYLSICRDLAASTLPEQVRHRIDETIFSLSVLMADQDFARREDVQKSQLAFFSKGRIDYTPHYRSIEKLLQAAEAHRICLVRYKASGKNEIKEHRFAPRRIVAMNSALYVLGAGVHEDFKTMRHLTNLAIHRIVDVILSERHFTFDIPDVEPRTFGLPWHEPKTFRIRFTAGHAADYVRERIWADKQRLEDLEDGGVMLEITTRSEPELMAWVRSFGDKATLEDLSLLASVTDITPS